MDVVVTGADGFIGKNLCPAIADTLGLSVRPILRTDSWTTVEESLAAAGFVVHLAGVNRPGNVNDYSTGNAELTARYCTFLASSGRSTPILFTSSIQASQDNPYGKSKREAELALIEYARATGGPTSIVRLPNVFGPGGRPSYNSVVATFAYLISHDLPITIDDPRRELELIHVDDVVEGIMREIRTVSAGGVRWPEFGPVHRIAVGALAKLLEDLHTSAGCESEGTEMSGLRSKLAETYLWYASLPHGLTTQSGGRTK